MTIQLQQNIHQLYEKDFVLWLDKTLEQLQEREINHLDWEHLIEEVKVLGSEQRHRVESYLKQLLKHLLLYQYWQAKWDYSNSGWKEEIRNFRDELELRLGSKTLYNHLVKRFDIIYDKAKKMAIDKTGLLAETFPEICPYSLEQVLDFDFLPR